MRYNKLVKAKELDTVMNDEFSKKARGSYVKALKSRRLDDILDFLKKWRVRVKIDRRKLSKAIQVKKLALSRLRKGQLNIMDVDLDDPKLHDIVIELFNVFSKVSTRRQTYTGASKMLHVLVPDLFVMWDATIRCAYGCSSQDKEHSEKYFTFLKRVQPELKELVRGYSIDNNCPIEEAAKKIGEALFEPGYNTFSRLVDCYNYQKFTSGKDEMWSS